MVPVFVSLTCFLPFLLTILKLFGSRKLLIATEPKDCRVPETPSPVIHHDECHPRVLILDVGKIIFDGNDINRGKFGRVISVCIQKECTPRPLWVKHSPVRKIGKLFRDLLD